MEPSDIPSCAPALYAVYAIPLFVSPLLYKFHHLQRCDNKSTQAIYPAEYGAKYEYKTFECITFGYFN